MALTPLKQLIFRDLDLTFAAHPETGNLSVVKNSQAISGAIKNLVLTNKYERLFQPDVYSNVPASLFEEFGPISAQILRNAIRDVIQSYEPRAELLKISMLENLGHNRLDITIVYRPLNSAEPVEIEVFLERVR